MDQVFSKENKTLKKYWKIGKNTGRVREKSGNFVSPEKWEPWSKWNWFKTYQSTLKRVYVRSYFHYIWGNEPIYGGPNWSTRLTIGHCLKRILMKYKSYTIHPGQSIMNRVYALVSLCVWDRTTLYMAHVLTSTPPEHSILDGEAQWAS